MEEESDVRYVGIWMMAGAVLGAGFWAAERARERMELLQLFRKMVYHLKNQILYANATLPEAVAEVGERFTEHRSGLWKEPGDFFIRVSERLDQEKNHSFFDVWNAELKQIPESVPLNDDDRQRLRSLGENLGYADREMQERTLLFYLEQADDVLAELKDEVKVRGKLYRSLGAAGSVFLIVFFV